MIFLTRQNGLRLILWAWFFIPFLLFGQSVSVVNSLSEIEDREGKIKLMLIRTWGDVQSGDDNQAFFEPKGIAVNNQGIVYIMDSKNNRIQTFDQSGKYKSSLGKMGEGPGEFNLPIGIALDRSGNIVVSDYRNSRIQILDSMGKYLRGFSINGLATDIDVSGKNKIALYNYRETFLSSALVYLYDENGAVEQKIGKHMSYGSGRPQFPQELDSIFFSMDESDHYYISYYCAPRLEKYSPNDDLVLTISFEMPFEIPKYGMTRQGNDLKVIGERVSAGLAVNERDHIFLITTTRKKTEEDKSIHKRASAIGRGGRQNIQKKGKTGDLNPTDLYRLLVFNRNGKIAAMKRLSVFCDDIYIHGNRLFIIDTFAAMKIYEYEFQLDLE